MAVKGHFFLVALTEKKKKGKERKEDENGPR